MFCIAKSTRFDVLQNIASSDKNIYSEMWNDQSSPSLVSKSKTWYFSPRELERELTHERCGKHVTLVVINYNIEISK